ncbi:MAG: hypothetical protein B6I34_09225 [Anaerolineaceae bacterium 4572_32.1]|nr:MAG: hypothetical protein B6I34_09225 [Anaerolineaceae bacterium 4572_32.1]
MTTITVRKLDHAGRQIIAYPGRVLRRGDSVIMLRTGWNRDALDLGYVLFEPSDRWTEHFYSDRWYNIFEIHTSDDRLKGWYCNITRPAHISDDEVSAEDLALDLWVAPDGRMRVLDEEEFAALPLSPAECQAALDGLAELQAMVRQKTPPFDVRGSDE